MREERLIILVNFRPNKFQGIIGILIKSMVKHAWFTCFHCFISRLCQRNILIHLSWFDLNSCNQKEGSVFIIVRHIIFFRPFILEFLGDAADC